jgi:hypothetical protein
MTPINQTAVDALCKICGLDPSAVSALDIHLELPGIVTVKTEFYLLAERPILKKAAAKKPSTK